MELTETHQDALKELVNIGYGRAAASLSQLTRRRIALEVPQITILQIPDAIAELRKHMAGEVASVYQLFSGVVSGQAMLLLSRDAAVTLNSLLLDESSASGDLHEAQREAFTEIGNILLNACLGAFGNVLRVQMTFTVPRFHMDSVEDILSSATIQNRDLEYALLVHTRFMVSATNVTGYLMMILGVTSLARLTEQLDRWEQRQFST